MSEPRIVAFLCNWCSYEGADKAGTAQTEYPANIRTVRVMCSGQVSPELVLQTFREGAAGVLVLGCHPGDCHYKKGNYTAQRRIIIMKELLEAFGIEPERLRLDWVSASEGERFTAIAKEMTETIQRLGPLVVQA